MNSGVKLVRKDHRDRSFPRTYGSTTAFPDEFNLDAGFGFPDQNADGRPDGCTGYAQTEICQDEDGIRYDPGFTYNRTRIMEGTYPQSVGCDIRTSLESLIVYGAAPPNVVETEAAFHRRGAYYNVVDSPDLDAFDDVRSAILTNKRSVSVATPWFSEWAQPALGVVKTPTTSPVAFHNWKVSGWKQILGRTYLIGKSWQGPNYGDHGYHYVSRETFNAVMAMNGSAAFTVRKADSSDYVRVKLAIGAAIVSYGRMLLIKLLTQFMTTQLDPTPEAQNAPQTPVPVPVAPTPTPTVPESEALQWDTPQHAYHAVRVMCDAAGLTVSEKNRLCACIFQESEFSNNAIHRNRDAAGKVLSTDYGICQINDYYHVGPEKDFPNVAYLLANPDKAAAFMIAMSQAGKLSLWSSYSSGAYQQWLSPGSPMWALAS